MHIKIIETEKPRHLSAQKCQRQVFHSGDGSTPRPRSRCERFAKYDIDGIKFCHQHAGETVLNHTLNT